ncbi:alpha/beta fold hydrolase [Naasia sp. SYSU D00948]|uniref:alpha/beta fold hydrolase n=1 Tax=Naasia sp. SYSU D00948 TaxID=2817379 RepID=UPI001B311084|nr:alpha/beta hydrolase [Naasia sp. SYSU D00948]
MIPETRTVEVDGLRIGYRRAGRGPPLLLLHGAFSDSREWRPQLEGLSEELDVIAMDCPGCGASGDPPPGFRVTDYADVVAGFLHALGLEAAHLGGLSFGSMCALVVYHEHPAVVRSLLLMSAYAGWRGSLPPEEVERRTRWTEAAFATPVEDWAGDFLRSVYSDAAASLRDEAMGILRDSRPAAFAPVARAFLPLDLRGMLPTIDVPTLLVSGELDERSPVPVAADLRARIPGARMTVIPGAGHGVNGEAPQDVNRAVLAFLSQLPA